jgi:hypothetical protein
MKNKIIVCMVLLGSCGSLLPSGKRSIEYVEGERDQARGKRVAFESAEDFFQLSAASVRPLSDDACVKASRKMALATLANNPRTSAQEAFPRSSVIGSKKNEQPCAINSSSTVPVNTPVLSDDASLDLIKQFGGMRLESHENRTLLALQFAASTKFHSQTLKSVLQENTHAELLVDSGLSQHGIPVYVALPVQKGKHCLVDYELQLPAVFDETSSNILPS